MLKHALIASVLLSGLAADARAVTIDTVPVGNAGNSADPITGKGDVAYSYRMGTTEVTIGQYTEFLNAVAATDTYALYNPAMATDLNSAGIARTGVAGSYIYSAIGSPNHPVSYVGWGDAARFSNWLFHGQPTGAQDANSTESGSYALNGTTNGNVLNSLGREPGATWVVPTENEWYKAAFHQNNGVTGDYWKYPTSTDAPPDSAPPPGTNAPVPSNTANFVRTDLLANGYNDGFAVTGSTTYDSSQNYLTDAGAYASATSPYGTFDQGGNVQELISLANDLKATRGGHFADTSLDLRSQAGVDLNLPFAELATIGFRVALVPEPSSFAITALGLIGLIARGRRHRR